MRIVTETAARTHVTMADAIEVIEQAFCALHEGAAEIFPVVIGNGGPPRSRFSAKSGLWRGPDLVGLKIGSYWPDNRAKGLASHGSTTLLLDDATGFPVALIAATYLTALRTAAADAVAVRALARADASRLAIIGAGHQAWYELVAVSHVRTLSHVAIWSRDFERAEAMAARARAELSLDATAMDACSAVSGADIVLTVTSAAAPLIDDEWIKPGTHISAMGTDSRDKQELPIALVARARRFADVPAQSIVIGEHRWANEAGLIDVTDITPIGAVLSAAAPGRREPCDITLFDSSGIALQDLAIGALALDKSERAGATIQVDLR